MRCVCTDYDGNVHELMFCELEYKADEDTLVDTAVVTMPYEQIEMMKALELYYGDELIFSGVVTEQAELFDSTSYVKLTAKSRLYLLKTSEAKPACYVNPSLPMLFEKHCRAHGVSGYLGPSQPYAWSYIVPKGRSDYQVLLDFCLYCLDTVPTVTPSNILDCTGERPSGVLRFGQDINYFSLSVTDSNDERLREILIQESRGGDYSKSVRDMSAVRLGVSRVRLETSEEWQARRNILKSVRDSSIVKVKCAGFVRGKLRQGASVTGKAELAGYSVAEVKYTFSHGREHTEFTLKKEV